MTKMLLSDGSEVIIRDGASLDSITTEVTSYVDVGNLVSQLSVANLSKVQFKQEPGDTIDEYENMRLIDNCLIITPYDDGTIVVNFGIRPRTDDEKKRADVEIAIAYLTDEQAETVKALYDLWDAVNTYKKGDRVLYNDELYKCLQDHKAQSDWTPDTAHSLWAEILARPGGILPWKQPDSTNGYHKGDKVTHKDQTWESDINNNVWEPGVVGTEALWHTI